MKSAEKDRVAPQTNAADASCERPPLTRDRLSVVVLLILTSLGVIGCVVVVLPFVPALTWAVALAVVAHPLHDWLAQRIGRPSLAAGVAVAVITVGLLAPSVFVFREVGRQAAEYLKHLQEDVAPEDLLSSLERNPRSAGVARWIRSNVDLGRELRELGETIRGRVGGWVRGAVWTATQFLITIFLLFYLLRDRKAAIAASRRWLPFSSREATEVIERVRTMIHATIYGTIVVAAVQGTLGGLMFWILGVPGALLWGVAMGLLSIVPVLGAFVVWVPAAIGLAIQGDWAKALILTAWGSIVVGLIDNLLYPMLVGKEMRLHTAPVFIAIIGGLFAFGASGLVLGPVVLAVTLTCLDVLRRRTIGDRSAEEPT